MLPTVLLTRLEIAQPGDRQKRKDMRIRLLIDYNDMRFRNMNLIGSIDAIFPAIRHFDRKRDAFAFGCFNYVACHS